MSDNARTTLAFTIIQQPVEIVVAKLADALEYEGHSLLVHRATAPPASQALFRPIADTPAKYQRPEWLETDEPEPEDKPTLAHLAKKYPNFAVHTTFVFAGESYTGSVFFFTVALHGDRSDGRQSFVQFSFHSYLTYALRGTREFGVRVVIDADIKAGLIQLALGLCGVLEADGFIYGLERGGPLPFSAEQLGAYLRDPLTHRAPLPAFLLGIKNSIISRAELIRVWKDQDAVKQSTSGFVLLDLLTDSEGVEDEDENEEEDESDPGPRGENVSG
jgi:hypothetical protein